MAALNQSDCRNRLLALMTAEDFARLAPDLEPCRLKRGEVLVEAGGPIETMIFFEGSVSSVITLSPEGLQVETGIVGLEGCAPIPALLGSDRSPQSVLIQVQGEAYRLPRPALLAAMGESASLRDLLLRLVQVHLVQVNCTALSNATHPIDERLARWLLMCHDRAASDDMPLTHDFLALMLAVRRPSVTTALHVLEGNGFIRAERGSIMMRDRQALEEFARDAYGQPEAEYHRLIGPLHKQRRKTG